MSRYLLPRSQGPFGLIWDSLVNLIMAGTSVGICIAGAAVIASAGGVAGGVAVVFGTLLGLGTLRQLAPSSRVVVDAGARTLRIGWRGEPIPADRIRSIGVEGGSVEFSNTRGARLRCQMWVVVATLVSRDGRPPQTIDLTVRRDHGDAYKIAQRCSTMLGLAAPEPAAVAPPATRRRALALPVPAPGAAMADEAVLVPPGAIGEVEERWFGGDHAAWRWPTRAPKMMDRTLTVAILLIFAVSISMLVAGIFGEIDYLKLPVIIAAFGVAIGGLASVMRYAVNPRGTDELLVTQDGVRFASRYGIASATRWVSLAEPITLRVLGAHGPVDRRAVGRDRPRDDDDWHGAHGPCAGPCLPPVFGSEGARRVAARR